MTKCGHKNENPDEDKLKQEITRLKKELNKKNNLYSDLDETLREADKNLSSIRTQKAEIDSILGLPGALNNKKLLLEKVDAMKEYAAESRKNIEKLEDQLANAKGQNVVGLKRIIKQLRKDLDEKEVTITNLKGQVQNLERNLAVMQTNLKKEKKAKEEAELGRTIAEKDKEQILSEKEEKEQAFEKYKNNPIIRNVDLFADRNPDRTRAISRKSVNQLTVKFNVPINRYLEKGKRYAMYIDLYQAGSYKKGIYKLKRWEWVRDKYNQKHTTKVEFKYEALDNQTLEVTINKRKPFQKGIHSVRFYLNGEKLQGKKIIQGRNATISFGD